MLIGSGTMDVGELLSYQVGEVGRLRPAGVAGPESCHRASSGLWPSLLMLPWGSSLSLYSLPEALVDPFDSFPFQA